MLPGGAEPLDVLVAAEEDRLARRAERLEEAVRLGRQRPVARRRGEERTARLLVEPALDREGLVERRPVGSREMRLEQPLDDPVEPVRQVRPQLA